MRTQREAWALSEKWHNLHSNVDPNHLHIQEMYTQSHNAGQWLTYGRQRTLYKPSGLRHYLVTPVRPISSSII